MPLGHIMGTKVIAMASENTAVALTMYLRFGSMCGAAFQRPGLPEARVASRA